MRYYLTYYLPCEETLQYQRSLALSQLYEPVAAGKQYKFMFTIMHTHV